MLHLPNTFTDGFCVTTVPFSKIIQMESDTVWSFDTVIFHSTQCLWRVIQVVCGNSLFFLQLSSITVYGGTTFVYPFSNHKILGLFEACGDLNKNFYKIMHVEPLCFLHLSRSSFEKLHPSGKTQPTVCLCNKKSYYSAAMPFNCCLCLLLHYKNS